MKMRDCPNAFVRDLLPDYVHGTLAAADHARVLEHLTSCADCAAEVQLIHSARSAYQVPAVDVSRIVAALPGNTRAMAGRGLRGRQWLLAAGVSFVLLGGMSLAVLRGAFRSRTSAVTALDTAVVTSPNVATDRAKPPAQVRLAQRESVANATGRAVRLSFGGGLSDLTDEQLTTLLREIETLDALLNAEPEAHVPPIVPLRGGDFNAW